LCEVDRGRLEFNAQSGFVHRFQKTRTELAMNFDRAANDSFGEAVQV